MAVGKAAARRRTHFGAPRIAKAKWRKPRMTRTNADTTGFIKSRCKTTAVVPYPF